MTYYSSPRITDWHRQIILGTVLGGSSIVKPSGGRNCYLFMRSKDKQWLTYKGKELEALASQKPYTEEGNTLRWHSNCFPLFNEFRDLFYVGGKKVITIEMMDSLRDIGLAIWYGDSANVKKKSIIFNTHKFGEAGSQTVKEYFSLAGIGEAEIFKERMYYRVKLAGKVAEKFLMVIADKLPDFMHNQLILE